MTDVATIKAVLVAAQHDGADTGDLADALLALDSLAALLGTVPLVCTASECLHAWRYRRN
jgi:hypothetical protein